MSQTSPTDITILPVAGMTCGHCVRAIEGAVATLPGVIAVQADLAAGTVRIAGTPDMAAVRSAITEEGYKPG